MADMLFFSVNIRREIPSAVHHRALVDIPCYRPRCRGRSLRVAIAKSQLLL